MNAGILFLTLALGSAPEREAVRVPSDQESCVVCHGEQGKRFEVGAHARLGLGCTSCHGGRGDSLEYPEAHGDDLVALHEPMSAIESCGGCHADVDRMRLYGLRTDQLSLYWTSRHGQALAEEGVQEVATCVSCHGSHAIYPTHDPRSRVHKLRQPETCGTCHSDPELMGRFGIESDTEARYEESVHGRALLVDEHPAAPACADCHGSHGAAPPRVREIEQVCGDCHSVVQEYYERSPHFVGGGDSTVQCVSCHENHSIGRPSREMLIGDADGHCGSCHLDDQDPALAVAATLHGDLLTFDGLITDARDRIREAADSGLFLGDEEGYLNEARALMVRARALTHTLESGALDDVLNRGRAMVSNTMESLEMKERKLRDRGIFTGIFFAVSVAFAALLLMYAGEFRGLKRMRRAAKRARETRHVG